MDTISVKLFHWQLEVTNRHEYHTLRREIFAQNCYYFDTSSATPLILDIGAHVGLAIFYFKRLFPAARIFAFEPNPQSFTLLNHNLEYNHIKGVTTYNLAVLGSNGPITLYQDTSSNHWLSTSGINQNAWDHSQPSTSFSVQATTLNDLVNQFKKSLDLVKLDVEGAEWDVLFSSPTHFHSVNQYLVEYHPAKGKTLDQFVRSFPPEFDIKVTKNNHRLNPKNRHPGLVLVSATKSPNS